MLEKTMLQQQTQSASHSSARTHAHKKVLVVRRWLFALLSDLYARAPVGFDIHMHKIYFVCVCQFGTFLLFVQPTKFSNSANCCGCMWVWAQLYRSLRVQVNDHSHKFSRSYHFCASFYLVFIFHLLCFCTLRSFSVCLPVTRVENKSFGCFFFRLLFVCLARKRTLDDRDRQQWQRRRQRSCPIDDNEKLIKQTK